MTEDFAVGLQALKDEFHAIEASDEDPAQIVARLELLSESIEKYISTLSE